MTRFLIVAATMLLVPSCQLDGYAGADYSEDYDSPPTSTSTQQLSGCYNGDGLHMNCVYGSSTQVCSGRTSEGSCYCPEPQPSEWRYCGDRKNCSRPEYNTYCAGPCPNGSPIFVHWCVSGQMPFSGGGE